MEIDYDRLREDLINYVGTATTIFPVATMDLIEIERASNERLIQIAIRYGFNIQDYKIKGLHR